MENFRKTISVNNSDDKQKLIHIYLTILGLNSSNNCRKYLIEQLKSKFDLEVTMHDLCRYFEPNLEEEIEDLKLQIKNLNL